MQVPILTADVDDERHIRPQSRDEAEVLLGTDADVDAAPASEPADRVGEVSLVRHEILGMCERAGGFRQTRAQTPEVLVAEVRRKRRAPERVAARDMTDQQRQENQQLPRHESRSATSGSTRVARRVGT